jgi:tight adherence protein C
MSVQLIVALGATFVTAVMLILVVREVVASRSSRIRTRLMSIAEGRMGEIESGRLLARPDDDWLKLLRPLARLAKDTPENLGKLQEQLAWAGYRSAHAVDSYLAAKLFAALLLGGSVMVFDALHPLALKDLVVVLVIMTSIGFYGPTVWLRGRISERQRAISRGLADGLDLLVSCVEAGVSLEAAIERVAREMGASSPILAEELMLLVKEIEAGLSRSDGFRRLAARTGVADVRSLAAILVQTEMFGTSVGRALRVLAESIRVQRMQRAQERAATVAVRLTIPLVVCLLPALMTVLLGGAVVRIISILFPTLSGVNNG